MDLILWRHAEASDGLRDGFADPLVDLERELTEHGRHQAERMAEWLKRRLLEDTRVLASPAQRTQQTARAFRKHFETIDSIAPGASGQDLLQAVGWDLGVPGSVLLVGHQPSLGEAAALVLGCERPLSVRKGGIVWLTSRARPGSPVVITAALTPALI